MGKESAVMQQTEDTRVQSLGQEDPLEEEMATHASILVRRLLCTEEPCGLQSTGVAESDMAEVTEHAHVLVTYCYKT